MIAEASAQSRAAEALAFEIRRELRQVQHDLQRDINSLGTRLKLFNIALGSETTREEAQKAIDALDPNDNQRTEEEATTA